MQIEIEKHYVDELQRIWYITNELSYNLYEGRHNNMTKQFNQHGVCMNGTYMCDLTGEWTND